MLTNYIGWLASLLLVLFSSSIHAQQDDASAAFGIERFSLHAQGTEVAQTHGAFRSPYSGLNSLQARRETRSSLTATLFLGARLWKGAELYVNPELSGGKGLSGIVGLAGFPNGDITRVVVPTPKPCLSRLFIRQSWGLSEDSRSETVEGAPNQLAGRLPVSRFTLTLGKFSVVDMFDANTYSHDPRIQFMNWSMMTTGTWDYPADTRGYTIGVAGELNQSRWTFRAGSFMVPRVANGLQLDGHLRTNHAEVAELETRFALHRQRGKLKFMGWANHANMGNYKQALLQPARPPDVTLTRRPGRLKYGFGLNAEQALTSDIGAFLRLGWDDGKTETWAFTEIDRTVDPGMEFVGKRWRRPQDALGIAFVSNSLSRDHRDYLAAGGYGFILGDGKLNPASERMVETYYALRLPKMFTLSLDYQRAANPAHNKDRGPVSIWALRLHWEM